MVTFSASVSRDQILKSTTAEEIADYVREDKAPRRLERRGAAGL
jgi:hypothetical protein